MTIFLDAEDRQRYCRLLHRYFLAHQIHLYHYCLMSNHVHLIAEATMATGLRHAMHGLNLAYALTYKRRYGHTGHFWQDRFKSLLIAKDSYLLQCGAYVELNPVRARMVTRPEAYAWSSYRFYATGQPDPLLTPNPLYEGFGANPAQRQTGYRQFVEGQLSAQTPGWVSQAAVGSPEFLEELAGRLGCAMSRRPRGRPRDSSPVPVHAK